jgi:hypothetical protein
VIYSSYTEKQSVSLTIEDLIKAKQKLDEIRIIHYKLSGYVGKAIYRIRPPKKMMPFSIRDWPDELYIMHPDHEEVFVSTLENKGYKCQKLRSNK